MAETHGKLAVALLTPWQKVAEGDYDQVVLPQVLGQATVLPGHIALLSDLSPGVIQLRAGSRAALYFITGGFVEVVDDRVVVLAEDAEPVAAIRADRAKADLMDAEAALKNLAVRGEEYAEQLDRVQCCRQRLQAAGPN